jgi:putative addiction module antidote
MLALKVTQVGNSTGVILPKEAVSRLNVEKGDVVYLTRRPTAATGSRPTTPASPSRWSWLARS